MDDIRKADVTKARQAIAKCSEVEGKIARAEACGIDCTELRDRCQHLKKFLMAFNEIHGPEFPAR